MRLCGRLRDAESTAESVVAKPEEYLIYYRP